ncbi:hypothetical protein PRUPE_4G221600 [Prunus persica]|uniref:Uncharacterized protein n=1 Tax=Prunus persica TaxID=3760 RepID=A0A251PPC2_PRUPE|nr:uncharacterized protein LOC18779366 [Prunus persica]ONI13431.1 hypothetical protein PRUPE_4G221600 [Prunus persica]
MLQNEMANPHSTTFVYQETRVRQHLSIVISSVFFIIHMPWKLPSFVCVLLQSESWCSAMRGHLFPLHTFSSRSSSLLRSLTACHNQRYQSSQVSKGEHSSHMNIEERAPSTAEEFKRVAEEKLKKAEQGVASQTADKTCDATEETTLGDSSVDSVKNRFKQHEPGAADYRRRSHDD